MNARHLLIETHAHIPPEHALEQLSAAEAERRLPGAGHSIADIVAHKHGAWNRRPRTGYNLTS